MTNFEQDNVFLHQPEIFDTEQQLFATNNLGDTIGGLMILDETTQTYFSWSDYELLAAEMVEDVFVATHAYIDSYYGHNVDQDFRLQMAHIFDAWIKAGVNPIFDTPLFDGDGIDPKELYSVGVLKYDLAITKEIDAFNSTQELSLEHYADSSAKSYAELSDIETDEGFEEFMTVEHGRSRNEKNRRIFNPLGWASMIRNWRNR